MELRKIFCHLFDKLWNALSFCDIKEFSWRIVESENGYLLNCFEVKFEQF